MIRQRLRGILGTTIAVSIPWTALGLVAGVIVQLDLIPGVHMGLGRPIPGGFVTFGTLAGAIIGIVNGLVFSGVLIAAERGKNVDELRGWRFATWGAVATAGTLGLLFQNALGAAIGGVVGGVAGIAAFAAVRRARSGAAKAPSLPV